MWSRIFGCPVFICSVILFRSNVPAYHLVHKKIVWQWCFVIFFSVTELVHFSPIRLFSMILATIFSWLVILGYLKKIAQNWFQVDLSMLIWKFQCFDVYYFETQRCFEVFVYWYLKPALMYVFWTFPKLGEFFNISSNTVCFGSCLHVLTCELNNLDF